VAAFFQHVEVPMCLARSEREIAWTEVLPQSRDQVKNGTLSAIELSQNDVLTSRVVR
jgi:hypothetical protein